MFNELPKLILSMEEYKADHLMHGFLNTPSTDNKRGGKTVVFYQSVSHLARRNMDWTARVCGTHWLNQRIVDERFYDRAAERRRTPKAERTELRSMSFKDCGIAPGG